MRRLLLKREVKLICRSVARFLNRSVTRAMGCFFDCFRAREDIVPRSTRVRSKGGAMSQNRLSSLFLSEEKAASLSPDKDRCALDSIEIEKGLKDEAKFLKACGTIPETPIEIRKASQKLESSHSYIDTGFSEFHSWLPNKSISKFQLDKKLNEPLTPVKVCEEMGRRSISSEQTPSSCTSNVQVIGEISAISREENDQGPGSAGTTLNGEANKTDGLSLPASQRLLAGNISGRIRSVRFECDLDASSSSGSYQKSSSSKPETFDKASVTVSSPIPTPLKLSDEMQTPGTIFPTKLESIGNGKARIKSLYVYSVPRPTENASLSKVLEEVNLSEISAQLQDSIEQTEGETPGSEIGVDKAEEGSVKKDLESQASLSPWLKPLPPSNEDNNQNLGAFSSKTPHFGRTPGDRPIIGMVAAHWNENEYSHISPKWWDGNGIPNSTNKYKEDQKVSWHATPFEERLEKALSEESLVSQRKNFNGRPMVLDDNEGDTAMSQLRPSPNSKSVVSF